MSSTYRPQPLAIIGMACRLPGAENLDQYWRLIVEGRSAAAEVPPERFDQEIYYDPNKGVRGKSYSKLACLLANRQFDHARCPISAELLHSVDNTHLLMTGVAAEALRHAGLDPFSLQPQNTAVFIGHAQGSSHLGEMTYAAYLDDAIDLLGETAGFGDFAPGDQAAIAGELESRLRSRLGATGSDVRHLYCNMVAGTVAKAFGLNGPWLALNSACASSLHAMLLGARALELGRAEMAIVGGASDCKGDSLVLFSNAQTLSTTASRPFDSEADGLIMSEGYVALVMKTLARALADGDPIQAVVRGLGVASDGRGKSLWAPRKEGQMKAMQRAYRSGVEMAGLQYLEAHATSTQVGDATELETLGEVLGPKFPPGKKIPITSAKANIGHALEAAGVAGVIKTVLCMQHQTFPPAINIRSLNTKVDWEKAPYYIPMAPAPWAPPAEGQPRRAAVNAFGIGGLNMHVVLDEFTESARQLVRGTPPPARTPDEQAIAVIGMGCIFPGASGLANFWETLVAGRDPKSAPPEKRWTRKAIAEQSKRAQPLVGGFITDYEYDWRKHKVPPKQVAEADPLQFMLLDAAQQALADAGYVGKPLDRETCGVVVGTEFGGDFCDQLEMGLRLPEMQQALAELLRTRGVSEEKIQAMRDSFAQVLLRKWPSLVDETGSFTSSTLASRITKTLDLAGGAVSIDSGSTSALSGLSICIDMLLAGDNDLMICASGQRRMGPNAFEALATAGLLAQASNPRNVLDQAYDGIVPAEGVGVVVLKRLADARRDGDRIHAIIRGLGMAHHPSHAEALRLAAQRSCAAAGIDASEITFAEIDTDERLTAAADELQGLACAASRGANPLVIGSSTAQFGHLGGAAGMLAIIKASLEIEHGQAVPSVSLQTPNIGLSGSAQTVHLARGVEKLTGRRLGAVACWSKGLACHLILEPGVPVASESRPSNGAAHSAGMAHPRSLTQPVARSSVTTGAHRICRFGAAALPELVARVETAASNTASAFQTSCKNPFSIGERYRLAIVADSAESLARKLQLARTQLQNPAARQVLEQQGVFYRQMPLAPPRVALVFPGQGSQYDGMLRELVRDVPAAAAMLAEIDATMARLGYPRFGQLAWNTPTQLGSDIWSTQIAMLLADTIMLAAARELGITGDLALGHSYGEFPALFAAGTWDLETVIRMTRARCDGIAAAASKDTGMLATDAAPELVERLSGQISRELYLANLNAPDQTVVGGRQTDLAALAAALQSQSRQAKILPVPSAFHTPLMAGASRLLEQQLRAAQLGPLKIPVFSTVTNAVVADAAAIRRNLADQLTTPVRYAQLIAQLAAERPTVFVEIGPQQTLSRLNRRILGADADVIACDNPKRPGLEPLLCVQALLETLGAYPAVPQTPSRPAMAERTKSAPSSSLQKSHEKSPMHDQIPHFDATERRRAKMRAGHVADTPARSNGAAPPPASAPPMSPTRPVVAPTARTVAPARVAPQVAMPSPVAARPPAVAPPKPVASVPAARVQPAAESQAVLASPSATPIASRPAPKELESFLINFVVEQTGYPAEVVELDADLEADLGIDSIKKAQLFGELQEYFDVGTSATNLSLDDFPTLRHVLDFLAQAGSEANAASAPTSPVVPTAVASAAAAIAPSQAASPQPAASNANPAELESFLINFVVEQTGYPAEVVELDADLEADLGIDSIKKAQLFGELQEYFDVGTSATNLSLDDFPTLRHVLDFLAQAGSAADGASAPTSPVVATAVTPMAAIAPSQHESAAPSQQPAASNANPAELESFLINFVVEQTGYPAEVVELDADLEADLGIDSIKKAQLFGELQEYFDVGTSATNLSLDDFPTLRHVLDFLISASPGSPPGVAVPESVQHDSATADPAPAVAAHTPIAPAAASHEPATANTAELESFLINFVVEQTGYPAEVVELDADLEADLGIDSIKKAQLFGELQEYFDVGTSATNLSLDDFPTLRHVLDFLSIASSGAKPIEPAAPVAESKHASNGHAAVSSNGHAPRTPIADEPSPPAAGTPYELGWAHGQKFKQQIHAILRHSAQRLIGDADESSNGRAQSAGETLLSPDVLDALQGLADAVEVPLDNVLAHPFTIAPESGPGADRLAMFVDQTEQLLQSPHASRSAVGLRDAAWHSALSIRSPRGAISPRNFAPTKVAPLPELTSNVTSRFVLEMRDAPLANDSPTEPIWGEAAIVLGSDSLADALRAGLEAAGVVVHDLSVSDDLDDTLAELERLCALGPVPHLFITSARDALPLDPLQESLWNTRRHEMILLPFFVCQKFLQLAAAGGWLDRCTLVAAAALGGDFGFGRGADTAAGGALAGLLKAIFIEYAILQDLPKLRVKVVDAPIDANRELLAQNIFRELASANRDYEVAFDGEHRRVPFAVERAIDSSRQSAVPPHGTWVVTGGARGITAACALELARRYGLKLHLIGASALPQIDPAWRDLSAEGLQHLKASVMIAARKAGQPAPQAWSRVEKDLEIDRTLRSFAAAGVRVTYHACDVADRARLSETLDRIRQADGPISGMLHGAGIDRSCRFDRKQRDVVLATMGAKVDGAAHLMALTRRDPIRHFIGFGSISGRLGSFGQTDYCMASDALCKLIGAYRQQHPWVQAVGFHWHPWDEVGMAARPETKNVLQGKSDLHLMPLAEGIAHLVRELAAGVREPEILITERRHWQRFAAGLGQLANHAPTNGHVQQPPLTALNGSAKTPDYNGSATAHTPTKPLDVLTPDVELHTKRCQLRTLLAPLPPGTAPFKRLDSPAYILGDNTTADALAARLAELGCAVQRIAAGANLDITLANFETAWTKQPGKHLFLMTGRDAQPGNLLAEETIQERVQHGILLPFFVAQRWYKLLASRPELGEGTLVAAVSLGGDFGFGGCAAAPDGGALAGLLKAIHIEDSRRETSRLRSKVIDAPADEAAASLVDAMLRELAAAEPEVEVCWSGTTRRVVRPVPAELDVKSARPIPRGGTWVVTGGARGITAIAARELARRYGWKVHLIGKSLAPKSDAVWRDYSDAQMKTLKTSLARAAVAEGRSPSEAWDRVMKDVEIFNNLRQFSDVGVQATYHACDIADRRALALVLDDIRRQDGPIHGILHGAGIIDPARFESKRRDLLAAQIGAKFSGTLHLAALTANDPLTHFIAFGSISGRFGGNGLTDYAAGNDALAKVIDWLRAVRPDCAAACVHWESWEGSGMATLPRFAWGPKSVMNMKYMQPEEGVRRLEQELQAGLPDSEVLYTFGDFYPMFYPHEQRPLGEFVPGALASSADKPTSAAHPLLQNVERDADSLTAQLPLDPLADQFLMQHRLRNKPLFPVVVGLEALAEAAMLAGGHGAVTFRNVQMLDGLLFHTDQAVTAQVKADRLKGHAPAANVWDCVLSCDFRNRSGGLIQKDRRYLRAEVKLSNLLAPRTAELPAIPDRWTSFSYPDGAPVYHGPAFRGVTGTSFERQGGWGRILSLPLEDLLGEGRASGWTVPSCVLDAALYACGIHLWLHGEQAVSLPRAIDELRLGRPARAGETCLVHFVSREITTDGACYDFTVIGEDRTVIAEARGYRKVILARGGGQ